MWRAAFLIWAALATSGSAQALDPADYGRLKRELDGIITFESLPRRAEPGLSLDENLYFPGAWLGERFQGQVIGAGDLGHDVLTSSPPSLPLSVQPGAPGRNQSVALHAGFGSNALFPLGPDGFDAISGRGEGAVAVLFDQDQYAIGLRLHAHYAAPLGNAPDPGQLIVTFYARDGSAIDTRTEQLGHSVMELGWRRPANRADIAGMLILNTDAGGIAVDDILFQRSAPLG